SSPTISYNWIVGNTSYDDGGGIYAMGNYDYDDQRARHDFPPDRPVDIEDNIIAGNNSLHGGPAGIRVSRWGRVNLRRNLIVANDKDGVTGGEGGSIGLMGNNNIMPKGDRRQLLSIIS